MRERERDEVTKRSIYKRTLTGRLSNTSQASVVCRVVFSEATRKPPSVLMTMDSRVSASGKEAHEMNTDCLTDWEGQQQQHTTTFKL